MTSRIALATVGVVAIVLAAAAVTGFSLERTAFLAPALVIGLAAVLGLLVFWGRVAKQHLSEVRRPRLVLGVAFGAIALLVALTLLGVELPHE